MKPMAQQYVIGVDLGSQGMKAILLDARGTIVASAYAAYDPHYPAPNWAEEDPRDWEEALVITVRQVMRQSGVHPATVVALALGSQVDGLVCVGKHGRALRPAIIWLDRRATEQCTFIEQSVDASTLFHLTGANLDSSHVAPKILWVRDHEPEIFEQSHYLLLPGSYMAYRLTGEAVVDYSNASSTLLFDVKQKRWSQPLLQKLGLEEHTLGRVDGATSVIGPLTDEAAERLGLTTATLVAVGSGDEHAACVGAGVTTSATVCDINGTAEPICAVSHAPIFDESRLLETH